jgi:uncharacterized protein (TIGR02266 family)
VATKTVVIADDTAFVRDRFKEALEDAGHRALAALTGTELLALVRARPQEIDLVVLDLRLPQASGVRLVRALRRLDPACPPIVVFSGTIADAAEVRELALLGVAGYVNEYTSVQHIVHSIAPHLFPSHYNRRMSPRVVLGIPVAYRLGNTIATAVTLNIGLGGMAIRTTSPHQVGTEVKVRFRLPSGKREIDAAARIAWGDRRIGMGLHFLKVDPGDAAALEEFVQMHFFSNRRA